MHLPTEPAHDYAKPELRALLDRGIEPMIAWIRELVHTSPTQRFHATSEWDNNTLACYLSRFLPKLPPTNYWQQDVLVIHLPQHWQNRSYNRIFTQISGNCLIPDEFHAFLLHLTRAFGQEFIPVHALVYWLNHGKTPEQKIRDEDMLRNQELVASIAFVEKQEQGTIDRSTITVLQSFGTLEWLGMLTHPRRGHTLHSPLHVKGEHITPLRFGGNAVGEWFNEMQDRGYLSRYPYRRRSRVWKRQVMALKAKHKTKGGSDAQK